MLVNASKYVHLDIIVYNCLVQSNLLVNYVSYIVQVVEMDSVSYANQVIISQMVNAFRMVSSSIIHLTKLNNVILIVFLVLTVLSHRV